MKKVFLLLKSIFPLLMSFLFIFIKSPQILTFFFCLLLILLIIFPNKKNLNRRLKPLIITGIFILIIQLIFNQSQNIKDRLLFSYLVFIKIVLISLTIYWWTLITSPSKLISQMGFLPKNIRLLLTMTFYSVPTIIYEATQISNAQKSRGLNTFTNNPLPLIIPLLHRAFKRSETLSFTIESRGFHHIK